ncbi:hypothetical protein I4U23_016426 [Adineta vaga]|nr:hypothetical protein I4U23_016426 [Adineta vaga]
MSLITLLNLIQTNFFRFGGPFLIIIGTISCTFNLIIFMKATLRKNPCSIYFIAVTISNFLLIYLHFFPLVTQVGYNYDPTAVYIVYCRIRLYAAYVFSSLGPFFLILASIDRTLITSRNAVIRRRSTCRLAITCIIALTLFFMIFHIHAFIYVEIIQIGPDLFLCYYQPGNYSVFVSYCSLVFNGTMIPLLMIVFGFWTIRNVGKIQSNVNPVVLSMSISTTMPRRQIIESKDRQLIKMLLVNISAYIILRFPFVMYILYQQITQYQSKSSDQLAIDYFVLNITYFLFMVVSTIDCYINLLVSKTFRSQLKDTFLNCQMFHFVRPN